MSTKRLVSLAENLTDHEQKRRGRQSPTFDEVAELLTEVAGPMAKVLREVCARQMALEDQLGFEWVPATMDIRGKELVPGHFVRCEPGVRVATCSRCGKVLETDAEKLTMLCDVYCGDPATTAGPGFVDIREADNIHFSEPPPILEFSALGDQGEGYEGGDRE